MEVEVAHRQSQDDHQLNGKVARVVCDPQGQEKTWHDQNPPGGDGYNLAVSQVVGALGAATEQTLEQALGPFPSDRVGALLRRVVAVDVDRPAFLELEGQLPIPVHVLEEAGRVGPLRT